MRTLNQSIANYMKQGIQPRVFVRIADSDGNDLLLQGTKVVGDYEDRITTFGSINQSVKPEGGMAEVSGASVNRLVLDERLTLCTEASLDPQFQNGIRGSGRILNTSLLYSGTQIGRNSLTGSLGTPAIVIGRNRTGSGPYTYTTARGFYQTLLPSDLVTCEDAYIQLTGMGKYTTTAFSIIGLPGTWTDLATGGPIFNDFTGWAASGDYAVTANWIEAWTTVEYGDTVYLRLNAAARAAIVAAIDPDGPSWFRIMLLSSLDTTFSTAPTGEEYVQFEADTAQIVLRYNSKTLDNQPMQILYGLETLPATISAATLDLIWTGVVDSWELNDREMSITGKQNDHKKNVSFPDIILSKDDYPNLPDENVGKILPVLYGDFLTGIYHKQGIPYVANENDGAIIYSNKDFVKTYLYDEFYSRFIIADHPIKTLDNMLADYLHEIGAFGFYAGDLSAIAGMNNKQIEIVKNETAKFPYKITDNSVMPVIGLIPIYFLTPRFTDYDHMVDEDWANYCTVDPNEIAMTFYLNRDGIISGLGNIFVNRYICFYTIADNGYDTNFKFYIEKYLAPNESVHADQTEIITSDGWHFINVEDAHITNEVLYYLFLFTNLGGSKTIKIYNFSLCVGIKKTMVSSAYIACNGAYDDIPGTITGTTLLLIENPSHVIESLARSRLSLVTTEIDITAFDTAATDVTGKKLAFQLLDRKNARELLDDISAQSRLMLWWDEQDRLTAKLVDSTDGFPNSGTNIPGDLDIFTITGDSSDGSFTHHPIISGLNIKYMGADDVKNDFVLRYKKNYATGEYSEVLTCDKDEENLDDTMLSGTTGAELIALCDACYDRNLKMSTLEFEAWAIRDEATATALMQHLVQWFTKNRYIIEFEAGISALEFDLGDFINVRDDRIEELFGIAAMEVKKWMVIGLNPNLNDSTYTIRAVEVE